MSSLSGKVIALTGGASGIGLATAKLLASRGAILSLADINAKDLDDVVKSLSSSGTKVIGTAVDVTKPEDVKSFISRTIAEFGTLDGAANLAGVIGRNASSTPLRDQDDTEYDFVMNVNVKGVFNCIREELRVMKSGASIVNAASVLGLLAQKNNGIYTASKHAVVGLTRTAAKEEGPNNIRINAIAPGIIDTPMVHNVETEQKIAKMDTAIQALDRKGKPEEMASIIAFLLSDDSAFVTGAIWGADGGWNC